MDNRALIIRRAEDADFDGIWEIFRAVVAQGDTYLYDPATSREEARAIWMPRARLARCQRLVVPDCLRRAFLGSRRRISLRTRRATATAWRAAASGISSQPG